MAYKPEQGRIARSAAFWSLALLVVYGCTSLNGALQQWGADYGFGHWLGSTVLEDLSEVNGFRIWILSWKVTPALLTALGVCALALWGLNRYLNREKIAELLIETENELKKVTWPTMPEAVNSSIVVVVCVMFLMGYLAGVDWWLGRVVTWILLGGS